MLRIAVIGGGITGLAAANRLRELDASVEVTLFEAAPRLGGVLRTETIDGYLVEHSADNFITNVPWAIDLCRRVDLAEQLQQTSSSQRQAFIVHRGRLCKVPQGFSLMAPSRLWPVITTPLLSLRGKLRLVYEPFLPARRESADESLATFARRRLGHEAFSRLVQPLVGGIYTADAEKLSMQAALPRFAAMERRHGSLFRGLRAEAKSKTLGDREASGARYSLFVTPAGGISTLVRALHARLPADSVRLNAPVANVKRVERTRWQVELEAGAAHDSQPLVFDGLIIAAPAQKAGQIVSGVDRELAVALQSIPHAGTAIVSVGYERQQIGHPLDGFGFVVPQDEGRQILAGSFSSVKFSGRAPAGHALVRVFVGGAMRPDLVNADDQTLRRIVVSELAELLAVRGEPTICRIVRWPAAMPQYHVGHCQLVERIEAAVARQPALALAGNAYHGVGIPQCIHSGETAAERVLAQLRAAAA